VFRPYAPQCSAADLFRTWNRFCLFSLDQKGEKPATREGTLSWSRIARTEQKSPSETSKKNQAAADLAGFQKSPPLENVFNGVKSFRVRSTGFARFAGAKGCGSDQTGMDREWAGKGKRGRKGRKRPGEWLRSEACMTKYQRPLTKEKRQVKNGVGKFFTKKAAMPIPQHGIESHRRLWLPFVGGREYGYAGTGLGRQSQQC